MYLKLKKNAKGYTDLETETYYDKGGYNVWNGNNDRRGYYVSVRPVEQTEHSICFEIFTGYKKFIEETGRLNRKRLAALEEHSLENASELIDRVLAECNLELADESAA